MSRPEEPRGGRQPATSPTAAVGLGARIDRRTGPTLRDCDGDRAAPGPEASVALSTGGRSRGPPRAGRRQSLKSARRSKRRR